MTAGSGPLDFDHGDPDLVRDPYATHRARRDDCPVGRGTRSGGFWVCSRYDDVLAAGLEEVLTTCTTTSRALETT